LLIIFRLIIFFISPEENLIKYFRASGLSHKTKRFLGLTRHFQILLILTCVDSLCYTIQLEHEVEGRFAFKLSPSLQNGLFCVSH
jgi:hypothetical protein